ncbi:MAG: hypothetical protein WBW98_12405, partial [Candidatus Sulfotelmatobacter sp.]
SSATVGATGEIKIDVRVLLEGVLIAGGLPPHPDTPTVKESNKTRRICAAAPREVPPALAGSMLHHL